MALILIGTILLMTCALVWTSNVIRFYSINPDGEWITPIMFIVSLCMLYNGVSSIEQHRIIENNCASAVAQK